MHKSWKEKRKDKTWKHEKRSIKEKRNVRKERSQKEKGINKGRFRKKTQQFACTCINMIFLAEDECLKRYSSKFLFSGIYALCEVDCIHSVLNSIQLLLSVSLCTVCCGCSTMDQKWKIIYQRPYTYIWSILALPITCTLPAAICDWWWAVRAISDIHGL